MADAAHAGSLEHEIFAKPFKVEPQFEYRETETLKRLIYLLEDEKHADTAQSLLARYTNESFQVAEQWQSWFKGNNDRIFFSYVGGFKFFEVPKGYIESNTPTTVIEKRDNG
ncbi:MAG: hypothetical protein JXA81_08905 [Sedimentisphaerales bacterium]|nr:hypothetical protein [Sedimentisphaerales bacterium]